MPTVSTSQPIPIDTEWAESLVGLRVKVPDCWWVNCDGKKLYAGVIAAVDFTQPRQTFFQLELDSELGAYYPMRYDSVFSFADEKQEDFKRFRLPRYALANPEGEEVRIARVSTSIPGSENVQSTQKWVKLYDIMLDGLKGEGRCVTMDSAYMGDIMAQIGRHEWKFNMVGTTNENRTGADAKDDRKQEINEKRHVRINHVSA